MLISVITPTHDARWLDQARDSLESQEVRGALEWLIVPNGDVELPDWTRTNSEVRVVPYPKGQSRNIGAIKRFCCEQVKGEIVVELDHDDMLMPNALLEIREAFKDVSVDFVYSNFAEFHDGTWKPHVYLESYGWEQVPVRANGHKLTAMRAFPPTAHSMSLVDFAPNHVRAWRASAYKDVGGHDPELAVCDDHDLCCRFYLAKNMKHIDECLYLYRVHGDNSYLLRNKEIRVQAAKTRRRYLWPMAERWADLAGLPKVDLGAAHGKPKGFIGVDMEEGPRVDIVHDVSRGLPFEDSSVGLIRAADFLEHIPDTVALMNEIWRVLVDGGWMISCTPSTDGRGAFQDPTHVSFFNQNSWWYFTNRSYAAYVPSVECRFQTIRLETYFPSDFHRKHDIPYVYADLTATKGWERRPGRVRI